MSKKPKPVFAKLTPQMSRDQMKQNLIAALEKSGITIKPSKQNGDAGRMASDPIIPMSPDELPQQRIHEVVRFPIRPEPFDCHVGYGGVPEDIIPNKAARSSIYLCQVEWAWSPMHNRLDAYYLHRGRRHWLLWTRYWDDNWGKWEWIVAACVPKKDVSERQAAVHLLMEFWKEEAEENDVDQFHWINADAYLSVAELAAIAREVWGDQS
jgi:hypothetical protein